MTPEQYIEELRRLIVEGRDQASLDFAAKFQATLQPSLDARQLDYVGAMLEGSSMAVGMLEARTARESIRSA